MNLVVFIAGHFRQAIEFVRNQSQLVLILQNDLFVVSEFHVLNLVSLALLLVVVDFALSVVQHFPQLADLSFKAASLILEPNRHFLDFPVNHRLPLALHHITKFFQLFGLALLSSLVTGLPLLYLRKQILVLLTFRLVFLFEREVYLAELIFETLVFVVKGLTDFIQLFVLLSEWQKSYLYSSS